MIQVGGNKDVDLDENLFRHMILNSLRSNRTKFNEKFGELVICCDDKNFWRKQTFPYYKANRKKNRDQSGIDWSTVFNTLNKVRDEIENFFPYKVIRVETAEADDVIVHWLNITMMSLYLYCLVIRTLFNCINILK